MTLIRETIFRVYDVDFTTLGSRTLSGDGFHSIFNRNWLKQNSTNESSTATLSLAGLTITPASTSDYSATARTLPGFHLSFIQLHPRFDASVWVRASVFISASNFAANEDSAVIALDFQDTSFSRVVRRGRDAGFGPGFSNKTIQNGILIFNDSVTGITVNDTTNNMMTTEGIANSMENHGYFGTFNEFSRLGLTQLGFSRAASLPGGVVDINKFGVFLGAMRNGSGTAFSTTFSRLLIEMKFGSPWSS